MNMKPFQKGRGEMTSIEDCEDVLESCFFNFNVSVNHLGILLICRDSDFTGVADCKYGHSPLFLFMLCPLQCDFAALPNKR
jgi:hypothetical protein